MQEPIRLREAVFVVVMTTIIAGAFLWEPDFIGRGPTITGDLYEHFTLCKLFSDSVLKDLVFPQWLQQVRFGLGGPNFVYYPPLYPFSVTVIRAVTGFETWPAMRAVDLLFQSGVGVVVWLCLRRSLSRRTAIW